MTQTPGTPAYMPPEVMVANPKYDTSVDEFSYGIMMIHMFSGRWPEPQVGQTRIEEGKLIPVTEAERREVFLNMIEENHPLKDFIHMCINNNPQLRPHAGEIIGRVSQIASQFPAFFANRLELLRQIERERREKIALAEEGKRNEKIIQEKNNDILIHRTEILALTEEGKRKDGIILQKENQISSLRIEVQDKKEQNATQMDRVKFSHSSEVEQLQLQLRDMKTQNQYTKAEDEAEIVELNSKTKILLEKGEQSARRLREEQDQHEIQLRNEREANRKLISDVQDLQSNLSRSTSEITMLQGIVSRLQSDTTNKDAAIQMKEATIRRKDIELEAKSRALGEKDATISAMSKQITKAREYLAITKLQVSTYLKVTVIFINLIISPSMALLKTQFMTNLYTYLKEHTSMYYDQVTQS